ncbi:MAG: Na+/H+ antiporter subunit E [Syntrophaceticus sp.]|jgi:multicomponent Na+:H+ antiporter subunit E|nr:Na+/H+ antiporter subunit E [Syntrophaceticus sp.]MDD3314386.1 Na+/H+ antiporter subunit E [Syntrophaceticus sp.]MDD4782751.1 Na+/H+ antiporter subunit E [Syntrophaceticus sp.]
MPGQVLVNLFIAILWMLLQDSWSWLTFSAGYLVGLFILFLVRRYMDSEFYPIPILKIIDLLLVFLQELLMSGIVVAKQILQPRLNLTPGIFMLETDLEHDVEVTLLAMLITLTPGSVVLEISPDHKCLYIHGMDLPESFDSVNKSKLRFEEKIRRVTRK